MTGKCLVDWLIANTDWAGRFVRKRVRNRSDVEDVIQEAALAMHMKKEFSMKTVDLRPYWSGVLKRAIKNYQRRLGCGPVGSEYPPDTAQRATPGSSMADCQSRLDLQEVQGRDHQVVSEVGIENEVLRLRLTTSMTRERVGAYLGVTAATVRGVEKREFARLRARLEAA